jgi:phosphoglycerate dehydrogenase-like enzyme
MTQNIKQKVLIIAEDAREYAEHIDRQADPSVPYTVCESVGQARANYGDHTIVFGMPDLIAEVIDEMPCVQWVQSSWAGVRPLLKGARSDYRLTGIKGLFGPMMSEYVVAYLLAHELRIVQRKECQQTNVWHTETSGTLAGRKAGIMGTGSIGRHIAGTLKQFGTRVFGYSMSGRPADNFLKVYRRDQLLEFLKELDYLVAILPETPDTDHLLDSTAFAALPGHAVLINAGRANVIDHEALVNALVEKQLAAAVLDVFDEEPLPPESPLWSVPGLTVTAHVAAHSYPAEITPVFLENYRRFCAGQPLKHLVDFSRGY